MISRFLIEPLDVLMFRNERPFTAVETHVAKFGGISPLTFEGAIKSKIFAEFCYKKGYSPRIFQKEKHESEQEFKERIQSIINKDQELLQILKLIGHPLIKNGKPAIKVSTVLYFNKKRSEEIFPLPNDVAFEDKGNGKPVLINMISCQSLGIGNINLVFSKDTSKLTTYQGYLSFDQLSLYLRGEVPEPILYDQKNKPYVLEKRAGIKLQSKSKKTDEGALYSAEFLRLKEDWGFSVWYFSSNSSLNIDGPIRLGGEGKAAIAKKLPDLDIYKKLNYPQILQKINDTHKFKLFLLSPAYLKNSTPPTQIIKKALNVKDLTLIGALPGKPLYVGGYDFAMNKEKPLKRWVREGAVYFYEFKGNINENVSFPLSIFENNIDIRSALLGAIEN